MIYVDLLWIYIGLQRFTSDLRRCMSREAQRLFLLEKKKKTSALAELTMTWPTPAAKSRSAPPERTTFYQQIQQIMELILQTSTKCFKNNQECKMKNPKPNRRVIIQIYDYFIYLSFIRLLLNAVPAQAAELRLKPTEDAVLAAVGVDLEDIDGPAPKPTVQTQLRN